MALGLTSGSLEAGGSQSRIPGGQLKALGGWIFQTGGPGTPSARGLGKGPLHHSEELSHLPRCLEGAGSDRLGA